MASASTKEGGRRPRRLSIRQVLFWLLTITTAVLVVRSIKRSAPRTEVTYSDMIRELDRENIAAVEIATDDRLVTGSFKSSVRIGEADVRDFRVSLPLAAAAKLLREVTEAVLIAQGKAARTRQRKRAAKAVLKKAAKAAAILGTAAGTVLAVRAARRTPAPSE